jgi:NAD(P)-dependent dehydrogenase (short-subunit alcohol dehydrogenase family)
MSPPLNPPLQDWRGRVVWLIGGSAGIGRALAQALHAQGARVVVSARSPGALAELALQHPGMRPLPVDVTDAPALQWACDQVLTWYGGRLDLVVACAGTYTPMRAQDFSLTVAQQHLAVNVGGVFNVLAAVLPALRRGPGHLSLVASVAGYRALPQALAYGPTKAALIYLAQGLHLDLAPEGVGISLINPGFVATRLTAQNPFDMPALQTPEQAAAAILQGWARGDFEIHFPHRFSRVLKLMGLLPTRLYERLVRRITGL